MTGGHRGVVVSSSLTAKSESGPGSRQGSGSGLAGSGEPSVQKPVRGSD